MWDMHKIFDCTVRLRPLPLPCLFGVWVLFWFFLSLFFFLVSKWSSHVPQQGHAEAESRFFCVWFYILMSYEAFIFWHDIQPLAVKLDEIWSFGEENYHVIKSQFCVNSLNVFHHFPFFSRRVEVLLIFINVFSQLNYTNFFGYHQMVLNFSSRVSFIQGLEN